MLITSILSDVSLSFLICRHNGLKQGPQVSVGNVTDESSTRRAKEKSPAASVGQHLIKNKDDDAETVDLGSGRGSPNTATVNAAASSSAVGPSKFMRTGSILKGKKGQAAFDIVSNNDTKEVKFDLNEK